MSSLRGPALRALRQPAAWSGRRSASVAAAAPAATASRPPPPSPSAAPVDDDDPCASFATLFRAHPTAHPLRGGESLFGKVVAASRGRSRGARFVLADFGLKTEVPFAVRELPPGGGVVGSSLTLPLVSLENAFGEPQLDVGGGLGGGRLGAAALAARLRMIHPALPPPPSSSSASPPASSPSSSSELAATAMRADHPASALVPTLPGAVTPGATQAPRPRRVPLRVVHGRYAAEQRGGVVAKVLGMPGFIPSYHVVVLNKVKLGSYAPFVLLSSELKRQGGGGVGVGGGGMGGGARGGGPPGPVGAGRSAAGGGGGSGGGLVVYPVYSPYLGYLLTLSNLVGFDDAWAASGGGGARERAAYLRLLTRIVWGKNPEIRWRFANSGGGGGGWRTHRWGVAVGNGEGRGEGDANGGGGSGWGRWGEESQAAADRALEGLLKEFK